MPEKCSLTKKIFTIFLSLIFFINFLVNLNILRIVSENSENIKINEENTERNKEKIDSVQKNLEYLKTEIETLKAASNRKEKLINEIRKEVK